MRLRNLLVHSLLIVPCLSAEPLAPVDRVAAMDSLLKAQFKADAPGAAVLVLKDGRTLLRKAYGLASVELQVPLKPEAVFHVGSVGKQFTAAAILRLAELGKLDVKAPLRRYLPEVPVAWEAITLEHLLTHTSGLDNLWNDADFRKRAREDRTPAQLLEAAKALPVLYPPGTGFTYATINHTLLAMVIERIEGQSYAAYLEAQFFKPLGMTRTTWDGAPGIVHGAVRGYGSGPSPAPYMSPTLGFGGGSFYSNTEDVARWTLALQEGRVLRPASLKAMNTPFRLKDGRNTHYGYGIRPHGTPERPYLQSNGDVPGFHSEVVYLPHDRIFVAILHHGEDLDLGLDALARRLAALAAGTPLPEPKGVQLAEADRDRLLGQYACGERIRTIRMEGSRLVSAFPGATPDLLTPLSPLECCFDTDPDLRLRFEEADGKVVRIQVIREDREPGPVYRRLTAR